MTAIVERSAPIERRSSPTTGVLLGVAVAFGVLLRLWDLGSARLSIDESYSALAARLPLGELITHLDATDPHPPLFYVLLRPLAMLTSDLGGLRLLSALASCASVAVMAIWMRRNGLAGLVATTVFALSPFQLFYGRQVRMYGLLALGGVVAAWALCRWVATDGRPWAVVAGIAGTAVAFSHGVGVVLLACMLLVPMLRRDREAWFLRGLVAGGLFLFAVAWGAHALEWRTASGGLPTASPEWLSVVVNETVAPVPGNRWLILPLIVGGAVVVLRTTTVRRVWVCLFAVPVVLLYVASLQRGVLVPKSLMPFSWGAPVAIGALVGWLGERMRPLGWAAAAAVVMLVVPYTSTALESDEGSGAAIDRLFAMTPSDSGVVVRIGEWQSESLVLWNGPVAGGRPLDEVGWETGEVVVHPVRGSESERASFVTMGGGPLPEPLVPCGPVVSLGGALTMQCVETGPRPEGHVP